MTDPEADRGDAGDVDDDGVDDDHSTGDVAGDRVASDDIVVDDAATSDAGTMDEVDSTEMPFLGHLEELRWRILKALAAVLVGALVCFVFSDVAMKVLTYPYEDAVHSVLAAKSSGPVQAIQDLLKRWRNTGFDDAGAAAIREPAPPIPISRQLQSLRPMTYFFVTLQIAFLGGLVLALPVVFYQFWQFVAPGLLALERRFLIPALGLSVGCFACGGLMAYWIVLPLGLRFFLGLEPPDMTSQWAVDEYISFVLRLLLGFGLVFELPVITLLLAKVGLVTPELMRRYRRYAIIAVFLLAAIFTPPDPLSQLLMALPLLILYEISIWVSKVATRK